MAARGILKEIPRFGADGQLDQFLMGQMELETAVEVLEEDVSDRVEAVRDPEERWVNRLNKELAQDMLRWMLPQVKSWMTEHPVPDPR